jgi:putative hydrolase
MDTTINQLVADKLREAADLLEQQQANPFRVRAYRRAADTLVDLKDNIQTLSEREGLKGLEALPGIGEGIARAIYEIVASGRWAQLERLRGAVEPEKLFQSVPGIGPELAEHIHDQLHIDTLEELELAAHDGRLEEVEGVGPRRAAAIRASLAEMLQRVRPRRSAVDQGPSVDLLLDVDREYREKAEAGTLPTVAPKRFNPEGEAWLPVLHTDRKPWHFTALFSNTARAHELKRTWDWVVIYFYDEDHRERQHTVVTETGGSLIGKRVVRGREGECRDYYERSGSD